MSLGLGKSLEILLKGFVQLLPNSEQAPRDHQLDEGALEAVVEGVSKLGPGVNGPEFQRLEPSKFYSLQSEREALGHGGLPTSIDLNGEGVRANELIRVRVAFRLR